MRNTTRGSCVWIILWASALVGMSACVGEVEDLPLGAQSSALRARDAGADAALDADVWEDGEWDAGADAGADWSALGWFIPSSNSSPSATKSPARGGERAPADNPTCTMAAESSCDGVDEDCDGRVDEGWVANALTAPQCLGECRTSARCTAGRIVCGTPTAEIPNDSGNKDEDCTGARNDERSAVSCSDSRDNDLDGLQNCADSDCNSFCTPQGGTACTTSSQCAAGLLCVSASCRVPHCQNGVKDAEEAGLDCGGPCAPCTGLSCEHACRDGEMVPPRALASLRFGNGVFTRSTTATYHDSDGVLRTASANQLRWIDSNKQRLALFEGPSGNMLKQSAALQDTSVWVTASSNPMTITTNAVVAPDGTQTAERFTSPSGPARSPRQALQIPVGNSYALSFYARATTAFEAPTLRGFATAGASESLATTATWRIYDGWNRLDAPVQGTSASGLFGLSHIANWPTAGQPAIATSAFAAWGMQYEPLPFPTSYIPTGTAVATRAADVLVFEPGNVPVWLRNGVWQIDVEPQFSSQELISGTGRAAYHHTLVSFGGTTQVSLTAMLGTLAPTLMVRSGATTLFSATNLTWIRGDRLRLTFDMTAGAKKITIEGVRAGGGTFDAPQLSFPSSGKVRLGGSLDTSGAANGGEIFAAMSEPRQVTAAEELCSRDASCTCGDGTVQAGEACDPAVGACDAFCTFEEHTECEEDPDCPNGQECADNSDRVNGERGKKYCWPKFCADNPIAFCGTALSACGECECVGSCDDAVCGTRTFDGCDQPCFHTCDVGEEGCFDNLDCRDDAVCVWTDGTSHCEPPSGSPGDGYLTPDEDQECDESCEFCNESGQCLSSTPACPNSCRGACDMEGRCYENGAPKPPRTRREPAAANGIGQLAGNFSVGNDGVARYSVDLAVPPGRAGLAPELSLKYSSSGGDGPIALGWSLTGISAISVCDTRLAEDGANSPHGGPALCLGGDILRPVFAQGGAPTQSLQNEPFYYRTRVDQGFLVEGTVSTHEVVRSDIVLGARFVPGSTFKVYKEDGSVLTFGGDEAHLFRGGQDPLMGSNSVRKWLLAKVEDAYGNRIEFRYRMGRETYTGPSAWEPGLNGFVTPAPGQSSVVREGMDAEVVIDRIGYNFDTQGVAHSEVSFVYNEEPESGAERTRPGAHIRYSQGGPLTNKFTLDRIEMHSVGRLVRSYDLGQFATTQGRVTLLDWVQECDYDYRGALCFPALRLSYGDPERPDDDEMGDIDQYGFTTTFESDGFELLTDKRDHFYRPDSMVMDGDGDGKDEFYSFHGNGSLWVTREDLAKAAQVAPGTQFPTFFKWEKSEGIIGEDRYSLTFGAQATDWNKDGLSDILVWGIDEAQFRDGENQIHRCPGNPAHLCGSNRGSGKLWARVPYGVWVYIARRDTEEGVAFEVKRILSESPTTESTGLAPAAGIGTQGIRLSAQIPHPGTNTDAKLALVDLNRDGLTDVLYCTTNGERGAVAIATGAHLGDRWKRSFDETTRPNLPTNNFQLHAVQGLDREFCARAMALSTRSDRTDLWDPESRKVLTQWRDGFTIFRENVFTDLTMSKYDVRVAELNGDTLPDLIMHHRDDKTGAFSWWFNTGTGFVPNQPLGFVPGQVGAPICEMKHLDRAVISDFNNDGLDDFLLPMCGAKDTNKVTGLVLMLARRGAHGVVEFSDAEGIKYVTPLECPDADDWAKNESPFSAFSGDFDGDGDRDLRIVGAQWSNGVESWNGQQNQQDGCSRIPKQSYCCVVNDEDNSQKCYLNGDAWTGQCDPNAPGEYDRATWKYFVQDLKNTTYERNQPAWYLLSKVEQTPVGGRTASELTVRYAAGTGLESWAADGPAGTCGLLPVMNKGSLAKEAEPTVYAYTEDEQCGRDGVSWCARRLPHAVVSGYSQRTSNGEGGWSDCADQRLFYRNGQQDAWSGVVGFGGIWRVNRTGGAPRSGSYDTFDVNMTPLRWARVVAERDRSAFADGARVPVVAYPFSSRAVRSTQSDQLPTGQPRESRKQRKFALLDVQGASGPTKVTLSQGNSVPDVRALGDDLTSSNWCSLWGSWCGRGQGPTQALRLVTVVEESDALEAGIKLSGGGSWTSYSPLGQQLESLSWSTGTSDLRALRQRVSDLRSITEVGGTRRLTAVEPSAWVRQANSELVEVAASVSVPRPTAAATPGWPARQAFIGLVQSTESAAFAPAGNEAPDTRHTSLTYGYDAKGQLNSTTRAVSSGETYQRTLHRDARGFVERIEEASNTDCEPSCEKTQRIVPDTLGVFAQSVEDSQGFVRTYAYDYAHGVPTRVEEPDGSVQRSSYDAAGRLEETYVEGLTRRTKVTRSEAQLASIATSDAEAALKVRGLLSESVVDEDISTGKLSSSYRVLDAAGREVRAGQSGLMGTYVWSETEYDARGRPWRTTRPHKESLEATQGTVRTVYDTLDRVVKVSSPSPRGTGDAWTEYRYGSRVAPAGVDTFWFSGLYAGNTWVTVETSSEQGHAQRVTGHSLLGRLNMSAQNAPAPSAAGSEASLYAYGVGGALTRVLGPNYDSLLRYYDNLGRLTRQVDPESGAQTFDYDGFGRLRVATDNATTREIWYDVLDRPLDERVETDLDSGNVVTTHWEWDRTQQERVSSHAGAAVNRGKLMEVYRSDGFIQRHTYGGVLGQLDSMRRTIPRMGGTGSVDLVVGYTYDAQGRLERTYYPGGWDRAQRLVYNDNGHVQEIISSGRGRPDQTVWKLTSAYEGQRYERYEVGDGRLRERRDYQAGSSMLAALHSELDGVVVQHDEFRRDDLGRVVRQQMLGAAQPVTFQYDPMGRLDKRLNGEGTGAVAVEDYEYSAGGRLVSTLDATLAYNTTGGAPKNAITALSARSGAESLQYQYYPSYALTRSITGTWRGREADVQLHYDGSRRIRKMSGEEGDVTFLYGLDGARVARHTSRADGEDTFNAYAGKLYEREERPDGSIAHVFRFTDGQGQTVFEESLREPASGSTPTVTGRVLIRDFQGSVLASAEPNASPELRRFSSFGTPTGALATTELGYTGHRNLVHGIDLGIDLVDMGGRVYDPNAAQFVQPDPTFPGLDHPQGFNRRHYVENDPLNYTDPTGYTLCDDEYGGGECEEPTNFIAAVGALAKAGYNKLKNPFQKWWTNFKWGFKDRSRRENAGDRFDSGPFTPPAAAAAPLGEGGDRSSATESGPETDRERTQRVLDWTRARHEAWEAQPTWQAPYYAKLAEMTGNFLQRAENFPPAPGSLDSLSVPGMWLLNKVAQIGAAQTNGSVTMGVVTGGGGLAVSAERAVLGRAAGAEGRAVYSVGSYRPSAAPLENHHGILDIWASKNIPGYLSRGATTPTVALTATQHAATKAVYRDWLFEQTGKRVGGAVDWTKVSPREMQSLADRMFDAAGVPGASRIDYYRAFHEYIYGVTQ